MTLSWLQINTAAAPTGTLTSETPTTSTPPAPEGSIGLSNDIPPISNVQLKQAGEADVKPTATTGEIRAPATKDTHVNGDFTFHEVDYTASGACGPLIPGSLESEPYYVAISKDLFTNAVNPNADPMCNKQIRASCK